MKKSKSSGRPEYTSEQLERLSAHDIGRVRLTEEEKRRLREINARRLIEIEQKMENGAVAEAPLVKDLNKAGGDVASVWDLVNNPSTYPALVPILLEHLKMPYPDKVREGIARALAVPEARSGWNQLLESYLATEGQSSNDMKWALHLALAACADESVLDTLIDLAVDKRHGRNRAMFIDALARIGGGARTQYDKTTGGRSGFGDRR